jgi:nicotinate-nucleotide pyrophosphorylase (carboxylating)
MITPHITPLADLLVRPIIDMALAEDLGRAGDITGQACIDPDARLSVVWAARQDGRVAGLSCARLSLAALDPTARFEVITPDGADAAPGAILARAQGNARAVLAAERTGLNLLGKLSGIATLTRAYVRLVEGTKRHHRRHPQDHARPARPGEVRRALRRRDQPPLRPG